MDRCRFYFRPFKGVGGIIRSFLSREPGPAHQPILETDPRSVRDQGDFKNRDVRYHALHPCDRNPSISQTLGFSARVRKQAKRGNAGVFERRKNSFTNPTCRWCRAHRLPRFESLQRRRLGFKNALCLFHRPHGYGRRMSTLEHAIRELRREVLAGLENGGPLPSNVACTADRMTLSIAVHLHPENGSGELARFSVATERTDALHRVDIEFKVTPAAPEPPVAAQPGHSQSPPPRPDHKIETLSQTTSLLAALSEVFGAPGFDSSARATVFRDVLEELDADQQRHVLLSLELPAEPGEEMPITLARHRMLRLACSGPAKAERGPAVLRELVLREPIDTLVQQAAVHWRTPSEWAEEASPYAPSRPGETDRASS